MGEILYFSIAVEPSSKTALLHVGFITKSLNIYPLDKLQLRCPSKL